MKANLPNQSLFIGKVLPNRRDIKIVTHVASGNDGLLFQAHSELLNRDFACKVIPRSNLQNDEHGNESWRDEVLKADALQNAAVVRFFAIEEWRDAANSIDCVVLVAEFVAGCSLRDFIRSFSSEVTILLVRNWLATMLNLFNEMSVRKITHGDLHPGNIIVEDRSSFDLLGPRYVFRVTDFGVAEATSDYRFRDDYDQLADILAKLLQQIDFAVLSPQEKFIFNSLRNDFLKRHLCERDLTRDALARRPAALLEKLQNLERDYTQIVNEESTALHSPFDFLSCEQIGDVPDLLDALYSDRFLGLTEIESRNNVVLTGPRGCGKTTVFRNLSLDQRMRVGKSAPSFVTYVGVYYRCDDLYFAFPRYHAPERTAGIDIPIHFLTATLLASLFDTVERWGREWFNQEFAQSEAAMAKELWTVLGIEVPHTPGYETFKALITGLNKERKKALDRQRFITSPEREIGRCFGPDVLFKSCDVLARTLLFLNERPIYFFIDDYSMPKVTQALQASLNRMLMQRASVCFFKLSTESPVSFTNADVDGKVYVESREFTLHNLGMVHLHTEVEAKLGFVEDVFRRRLQRSSPKFPASELVQLVGNNPKHNNNEIARNIRADNKPKLWGCEVLCMLCSGEVHYLITLVGDMVQLVGGVDAISLSETLPKLPEEVQNTAIRRAAGSFLKNLRGVPGCGEQLVAIVEAFGNVAHSHMKFLNSRNETDSPPPKQATRIEPYEPFKLSDDARRLYDELLRYSVFMEDFRGKSRRGHVVPRLFLRRFLIPHFNLTFSTRDSIEVESSEFESFLLKPRWFEEHMRLKSGEQAKKYEDHVHQNEQQLSLKMEGTT